MIFEIRERSETCKECVFNYSKSDIDRDYHAKLHSLKFDKKIQLKGYRPRHAPIEKIEQAYQGQIMHDLVFERIEKCWEKVQKSFTVITRPEIEILPVNYQNRKEYSGDVEVKLVFQVEIANYLKVLRHQFGKKTPVERAVQLNDEVVLNTFIPKTGKSEQGLELVVNELETLSEFVNQIVGMNIGEKKTIEYTPVEYQAEQNMPSLEPVSMEVEIVGVKEIAPATDLELMSSILELKNVQTDEPAQAIATWVNGTIRELNVQKAFRINEERLLKTLDAVYQFEIPQAYLENTSVKANETPASRRHEIKLDLVLEAYRKSLGEISISNQAVDFIAKVYAQDHGVPLQMLDSFLQNIPAVKKDFELKMMRRAIIIKLLEMIGDRSMLGVESNAAPAAIEAKPHEHVHGPDCKHHHHSE